MRFYADSTDSKSGPWSEALFYAFYQSQTLIQARLMQGSAASPQAALLFQLSATLAELFTAEALLKGGKASPRPLLALPQPPTRQPPPPPFTLARFASLAPQRRECTGFDKCSAGDSKATTAALR